MNKQTIKKKKRILSRITLAEYRELLTFVEEFYLAEYSLKILIARKGSNLFSALIDLVREEDGGRVRQLYEKKFAGKEEPVIISDRALDYYAEDIKNGLFQSILIGDDTIRHGRTIFGLYDKIMGLLSEYADDSTVHLRAFAACKDDMPKRPDVSEKQIKHYVNIGEYRVISDMVIDILPLSGQPYTSYIPNVALQGDSPLYKPALKAMHEKAEPFMELEEQQKLNLRSAVWIDQDPPDYAMFQSIRFYLYEDLELCTLVPMVSLMPISDESLSDYSHILKEVIRESYYQKVLSKSCELGYRTIIYTVSSLLLRQFIRGELKYEGSLHNLENQDEERLNFGDQILNRQKLNEMSFQDITEILGDLRRKYQAVDLNEIPKLDSDIEKLHHNLSVQFLKPYLRGEQTDSLVKKFFSVSGDYNEELWTDAIAQGRKTPESSCGYPFFCLADQIEQRQRSANEFYANILSAIDYGRGAIVARKKRKGEKTYFLPLLTAGERNYKYKEERYFPILYGLYKIEQKAADKAIDPLAGKKAFLESYKRIEQLDETEMIEINAFCDTDITVQYMPVLLKDVWFYQDKDKLNRSKNLADEIMK